MDPWHWALLLKPFALLAFFVGVAGIAIMLQRVFPAGPLKDVLFDRTYRKRHPVAWTLIVLGFWFSFIIALAVHSQGV